MGPVWENKGTIALPTDLSVAVTVVIGRSRVRVPIWQESSVNKYRIPDLHKCDTPFSGTKGTNHTSLHGHITVSLRARLNSGSHISSGQTENKERPTETTTILSSPIIAASQS